MSNFAHSAVLDLDLDADGWLTVWVNDPENRNPLTFARMDASIALCDHLEKAGPSALATGKRQFTDTATMDVGARLYYAAELFAKHVLSEEACEGIASFVEKRAPLWAGVQSWR